MTIAIVGHGAMGRLHEFCYKNMRHLMPDLEVDPEVRVVVGREPPVVFDPGQIAMSVDAWFARRDMRVDIVDCCAPTSAHEEILNDAVDRDIAFLSEKPLTATMQASQALLERVHARSARGTVSYHMRAIPAIQEMHDRIRSGCLGTPIGLRAHYYRSSNLNAARKTSWRFVGPGSGVLRDLGSHLVDLVLYLVGEVAAVSCATELVVAQRPDEAGRLVDVEGDDCAWLSLRVTDGPHCQLHVSKVVPGAIDDFGVELYGSDGWLRFDSTSPNTLQLGKLTSPRASEDINTPALQLAGFERSTSWLQWQLASLSAALTTLVARDFSLDDFHRAVAVDRILTRAYESATSGGLPLPIDFPTASSA